LQVGPREIARRLGDQAEAVCRYLLPGGKKIGNDWTAGGISGSEGKSLKISVSGAKAGIGADFADPESFKGDLLDLWKAVRGCSMRDAIVEAKAYLGLERTATYAKEYRKPEKPKVSKPSDPVKTYLYVERKISFETQELFRIRSKDREIVFPFFSPDRELVNVKYLSLDREHGRKKIRAEGGCAPSFFGWHAIAKKFPDSPEVVITEGEIDAMTWVDAGFPALSIPSGVNSIPDAITYDWDNLSQFETIYLCPDADKAGEGMIAAFADRIGKARLRKIALPFKDPNEAKTKGDWKSDDFAKAILEAKGLLDEKIVTYPDVMDEIVALKNGEGALKRFGYDIELLGPDVRIVRGHTFLVAGYQGHGKTLVTNQIALELASRGETVAIASLEVETLELMTQIVDLYLETDEISDETKGLFLERFEDRFIFLREFGRVALASVMEFFEYARSRYGATHFVLDNLTKLRTKIDDYGQQSEDINRVTDYARDNNVTIWIVSHLKKRGEKKHDYEPDDVRGSGVISDLASTVLQVVRNKDKEHSTDPIPTDADTTVYVTKQRVTGKEPRIYLFKMNCGVVKLERRKERKIHDEDIPPASPKSEPSELSPRYRDD